MAEKAAREALEQRLSALEKPSTRTIGHVLFSPKISEGRSPSGEKRWRDWAFVEVDQEMHETVLAELTNRCDPEDHYDIEFDRQTHTVELKGAIAEHVMRNPPMESASLQEAALVVGKYGWSGCQVGLRRKWGSSIKRN
ncbi:hypothetical protein Neosp_013549 [[Neocosmospora] mangrovei]